MKKDRKGEFPEKARPENKNALPIPGEGIGFGIRKIEIYVKTVLAE